MLLFFRKIRRALVGAGSVGKPASPAGRYILYAIGEIFLVVIGILIALQVNNWNQERQLRKTERVYLGRIFEDIQSMLANSTMYSRSDEYLGSTLTAIKVLENCSMSNDQQEAFHFTLASHQALSLFQIERTAYDEMLAIGMFAQLKNDSLKSHISDLYSTIENAQNRIEYFRAELGRASQIIMQYVQFTSDGDEFVVLEYDFYELCRNRPFRNAVIEVYDARSDTIRFVKVIMAQLSTLQELLEKELSENT